MADNDLAGRYMDFVEKTAGKISALEADNRTNKSAIATNTQMIHNNGDKIVKTNEAILIFKLWVENNMSSVTRKTVVYVAGIVGLLGGAIVLLTQLL